MTNRHAIAPSLWVAITTFFIAIAVNFFQWPIIDVVTPFLFLPLIGLVFVLFVISLITSLVRLIRVRHRQGIWGMAPLLVNGVTVLAVLLVPFTRLWLALDFHWHRAQRREVISMVQQGELATSPYGLTQVPKTHSGVTAGGSDILVRGQPPEQYVFFFTFRGILDSYSGFLYVPEGLSPDDYDRDLADIEPMGDRWYFVRGE